MFPQRTLAQTAPSCSAPISSPSDLNVQLIAHGGQTLFRQGERIKLKIRYTSPSREKYLLDNRSYDRSGRLDGVDLLCLEPNGGTDPLDDYFHSYGGFIGGGLSSEEQIGISPLTTGLELNEWKSLPPGKYRLSILSNRIFAGKESDYKTWNRTPVPGQSNWIRFQVVSAEPAWQSSALSSAVRTLDSPKSTQDEREDAAKVLRFLNSEDAARELVRRFSNSQGNLRWEFEAGLYGTHYRETAIQEMRAVLRNSQGVPKEWFVDLLVILEMQSDPKFRRLRYGSESAENEKTPRSGFEAEHKRRVAEYSSKVASGTFK
jgi:hypothetical protein